MTGNGAAILNAGLFLLLVAVAVLGLGILTGNVLVFTTPPVMVCVGWPDDAVPSWICTPDYTAKEVQPMP